MICTSFYEVLENGASEFTMFLNCFDLHFCFDFECLFLSHKTAFVFLSLLSVTVTESQETLNDSSLVLG